MGIVSRIAEKLKGIGRRKPAEEVRIDAQKGRVQLLAKGLRVKMELFKLIPKKRAWGFELIVENRSEKDLNAVFIWFTRSKHASLERLPPGKIAIKTVELSFDEAPLGDWEVRVERAAGGERLSSHFVVPLHEVFGKLREEGKVDVIEEGESPQRMTAVSAAWKSQPAARQEKDGEKPKPQNVEERIREIGNEKEELVKQFMRRQIDYQSYSQLMNALNKELLELKTKTEAK